MKYFLLLISFMTIITIKSNAYEHYPNLKIHYELEVINPAKHLIHIKVCFKNYPLKTAKIKLYPYFDADKYINLDDFNAKSIDDKEIEVIKEDNVYILSNIPSSEFYINYKLFMNQYQKGYMGYLCDSYLLSNSAWTFVTPENITAGEYSATFNLPSGWSPVTPWTQKDNKYVENDFYRFFEASYGAGLFDIVEENISGTTVRLALDKHFDKKLLEDITENCFKIFRYYKSIFDTNLPKNHLSIFAKATESMPAQWQYVNEACFSHGEAVDNLKSTLYSFAHRVFHTFNIFYPNGMDIKPTWFIEGTDEYFFILALMKLHFGKPLQDLANKYKEIYLKQRESFDDTLAGDTRQKDNWDKDQFLAYNKGALVSFLLDREIKAATKGNKSLEDVFRILYKTYGQYKRENISDEVIIDTVSKIVSKDMSYFFDKYLNNTALLDMDSLFQDNDDDEICNAAEEFLGTEPNKFDTDGDGASDYIEYKNSTDPLSLNSTPNQIIYIDGFDSDWNKIESKSFLDNTEDSKCESDITEINYMNINNFYHLQIKFKCNPEHNETLRYYMNVDTDFDNIAEIQFAAVYGTVGDTSKFKKDWSNYDLQSMENFNGLESAVNKVVEFKIPNYILKNKKIFQVSIGVWDTKTNKALDDTIWLKVEID